MDSKIRVQCNECGKKWKVSLNADYPQCSRCNSVDIDIIDAYAPLQAQESHQ